jgi:sortase A
MSTGARHTIPPIEWLLGLLGALLLLYVGAVTIRARVFQQHQTQVLEQALAQPQRERPPTGPVLEAGALIGSLEIPRVHLSVIVTEGDTASALSHGLGHLPDTALPWQRGSVAVAGHRDTYFRPLKQIEKGDEIRLRTPWGNYRYVVTKTMIVKPDDVSVLRADDEEPALVLITCYPFSFVGQAPWRFVVRAERRDAPAAQPRGLASLATSDSVSSRH